MSRSNWWRNCVFRIAVKFRWNESPNRRLKSPPAAAHRPGPITLICRSTVSPTVASELLKTAVTLGGSARVICAIAITAKNATSRFGDT